jgi:dipeptidyl aminopeptidase/acylaminoacyl peptidase
MSTRIIRPALLVAVCAIVAFAWMPQGIGAQAPTKRPLSYDAYDYWRSIQGTRLSDDGQWLAYALTSQGADGELIVRNVQSGQELRHARGTSPQFTPDGKYVVFTIVPPRGDAADEDEPGEAGGAAQAGGRGGAGGSQASRNATGIMALPSGTVTTVEQIGNFRMPEESSTWLAMHKGRAGGGNGRGGRGGGRGAGAGGRQGGGAPPAAQGAGQGQGAQGGNGERRKDPGTDLIVRNLATGQDVTIPDVVEYAWEKKGDWLIYATSSTDAAKDGAFARRMSDGAVTPLRTGRGHYKSLAIDEAGQQVAFLSDMAEYEKPVAPYRLYYWKPGAAQADELVSGATRGMPEGMVVSDNYAPRFSEDGRQLFLGTAPPPPAPRPEGARAPLRVDLWHYQDPQLQPMQQVRANQDRTRNYRAVVHLGDKRFVQLATPDLPNVNQGSDPNRAVGTSDLAYRQLVSWDQTYNDVYLVDLKTGQPRKILEKMTGGASMSPGGKYLLFYDEFAGHWFSHRIADGLRTNLTERINVSFRQESHDTPDLPGSYGSAGWTADDRSVLLYDRYDIWEIRPDGSGARMITNGDGRAKKFVYRYRSLDPDEETIPTSGTLLLQTTNEDTRASGYSRVAASGGVPESLILIDKAVGAPTKAKNADVVVFTQSRFDEFPDLWLSNTSFATPRKVSNANPQQAEYIWGKAENIEYLNADGKKLKAMLIKPENFDPAKKYPMMVYIYEELTQGLHSYRAPNVGTSVNLTRYVSNGYVVLQPDIIYDTGYPGESAEKCVIPAVNTVVDMGFIDPARIGIQGHSWGGYQITHLITRTDMFAAVEAGASVANMISAYGGIRWGTGMSRAFQYEKTQSRIGAPPWEAPLQFIENSPIFWVEKVKTPYLTIHNDADDAVPWYQAIEFFSAMRRLGKEAYFFNYNGELHGLRNRDNMKHWTVHMDEFFDHYLLGKPKPEWMEKGVPYLERGTRDVSALFKRNAVTPAPNGK